MSIRSKPGPSGYLATQISNEKSLKGLKMVLTTFESMVREDRQEAENEVNSIRRKYIGKRKAGAEEQLEALEELLDGELAVDSRLTLEIARGIFETRVRDSSKEKEEREVLAVWDGYTAGRKGLYHAIEIVEDQLRREVTNRKFDNASEVSRSSVDDSHSTEDEGETEGDEAGDDGDDENEDSDDDTTVDGSKGLRAPLYLRVPRLSTQSSTESESDVELDGDDDTSFQTVTEDTDEHIQRVKCAWANPEDSDCYNSECPHHYQAGALYESDTSYLPSPQLLGVLTIEDAQKAFSHHPSRLSEWKKLHRTNWELMEEAAGICIRCRDLGRDCFRGRKEEGHRLEKVLVRVGQVVYGRCKECLINRVKCSVALSGDTDNNPVQSAKKRQRVERTPSSDESSEYIRRRDGTKKTRLELGVEDPGADAAASFGFSDSLLGEGRSWDGIMRGDNDRVGYGELLIEFEGLFSGEGMSGEVEEDGGLEYVDP
ncbi:hypothetical protein DFP72DRAFT_867923 [Ephemerocybe angulata]|uniref:Uncharacterized protein n=1 Tax=Ephemerocybe angulata TaxID=980116 RepID=A0A8H6IGZ2_9AGAR|nr:hypothetical protein DFP72DRAFT_867923 [Tulosesus angulatus]